MFWDILDFPIIGLSPMDGVTDAAMRFISKKHGQADIIYTEFVSAEGLWRIHRRGEMDHKIWKELIYSDVERPVIAQIFGSDPEAFYESAKIICGLGYDGIDINMGCPSPGLEKRGGGAGLIRDKCNAEEVIAATRRGVDDFLKTQELPNSRTQGVDIPVSVKTRIGSAVPDESWWEFLAKQKLPAVAMHGRTFKQLYKGEADWDLLIKASEVIRESGAKFLGNGDVTQISSQFGEAQLQCSARSEYGGIPALRIASSACTDDLKFVVKLKSGREVDLTGKMDGILIGRDALGNPWVMRKDKYVPTLKEKMSVMIEHAYKYEELFKKFKNSKNQKFEDKYLIKNPFQFFPMRKHLASYIKGFDGSVGLRKRLMLAENAEQVESLVVDFFDSEKG